MNIPRIIRVEAIAENQSLKPDLTALRRALSKLHKASTKLDHAKYKAEKRLRKALLKLGKKASQASTCMLETQME